MVSAAGGGTTFGNGVYDADATVTATAVPDPGYMFVNWTDGGTIVSDQATYEFPLLANREIIANFAVGGPAAVSDWQIF